MVALKPAAVLLAAGCFLPKQERRGGIETSTAVRAPNSSLGKQERRGGIETVVTGTVYAIAMEKQERRGGIETGQLREVRLPREQRSRNAVVALKHRIRRRPAVGSPGSRNAVVALKLRGLGGDDLRHHVEAGTPWWH